MDTTLDSIQVEAKTLTYAGFWIRVGAAIIDGIILGIVQSIVGGIFGISMWSMSVRNSTAPDFAALMSALVPLFLSMTVFQWLYYALMESSSNQGTLGKMACGIKVTNLNGERITFLNATGRYFSKILSSLILCIGYIMVAFTEKKQGLHDMIAGTLVVYKR
jgi:uncharacterized RDD family membrane protein YckC